MKLPGQTSQFAPVHWLRQSDGGVGVTGSIVNGIGVLDGIGVQSGLQFGYVPVAACVQAAQSFAGSNPGGHVAHVGPVHALRQLHLQPVLLLPDGWPLPVHTTAVQDL